LRAFPSRSARAAIETADGVRTLHVTRRALVWLAAAHVRGVRRFALFPALASEACRWGALDLDAHTAHVQDRRAEALATLEVLAGVGVAGYMAPSRLCATRPDDS